MTRTWAYSHADFHSCFSNMVMFSYFEHTFETIHIGYGGKFSEVRVTVGSRFRVVSMRSTTSKGTPSQEFPYPLCSPGITDNVKT